MKILKLCSIRNMAEAKYPMGWVKANGGIKDWTLYAVYQRSHKRTYMNSSLES